MRRWLQLARCLTAAFLLLWAVVQAKAQTKLRLHDVASDVAGYKLADLSLGPANTTAVTATTASGTDIQVTKTNGGATVAWLTPPLHSGVTISGTVTCNIYAGESATTANAALRCRIYKYSGGGEGSAILTANMTTELTTSTTTVRNWTGSPTSTAYSAGDRIVIKLFLENCATSGCPTGTMAGSQTVTVGYDGTTDGSNAASWVQTNENLSFDNTVTPTVNLTTTDAVTGIAFFPAFKYAVSCSNTSSNAVSSGGTYTCPLPQGTAAGDTVVFGFQYSTPSRTITVSDENSQTYSLLKSNTHTSNNIISLYCSSNVAAGTQRPKVTFTGGTASFVSAVAMVFNNTSCTTDGTSGASSAGATAVAAGSFTPASPYDMLIQYALIETFPLVSFIAGSNSNITWVLHASDIQQGQAVQAGMYSGTAAINPTLTQDAANGWNSVAVALKPTTSASGTAATGMYVAHLTHTSLLSNVAAQKEQVPCTGNLQAHAYIGETGYNMTTVTDGQSSTYTVKTKVGIPSSGDSQLAYAEGVSCPASGTLAVTVNTTGTLSNGGTDLVYDIAGAATSSFDTSAYATATGTQSSSGNLTTGTVTPTTAGGITVSWVSVNAPEMTSCVAPSGCAFESATFTGETSPSPVDQNNGWMSFAYASTATQTHTWGNNAASGVQEWAWVGAAFKAPSGSSFTGSPSESLTTTPSVAASHGFNPGITETLSPTYAVAATAGRSAGITENLTTAPTVAAAMGRQANPSESLTTVGSVTALKGQIGLVTENLTTSPSVTANAAFFRGPPAESHSTVASVTGVVGSHFFASATETLTTSDTVSKFAGFVRGVQNTSTTTASVTAVKSGGNSFVGNVTEGLVTTDSAQPCTQTNCLVESLSTSATVTAVRNGGATFFGNVAETHTTSATVTALSAHGAAVSETMNETDQASGQAGRKGAVSETLSPSQTVQVSSAFTRGVTETHTTTAVATGTLPGTVAYTATVTETHATTPTVTALSAHFAAPSENLSTSDSVSRQINLHVTLSETQTGSDLVVAFGNRLPNITESQKVLVQTDNFNRADQNPIGAPWLSPFAPQTDQLINGAVAASSTSDFGLTIFDDGVTSWPAPQYVQGRLVQLKNRAGYWQLVLRYNDAGNFYYGGLDANLGPSFGGVGLVTPFNVQRMVNGVLIGPPLGNLGFVTPQIGDVFRITAVDKIVGTELCGYQNDALVGCYTDLLPTLGPGRPGFMMQTVSSTGNPATDILLDDWSAGAIGTVVDGVSVSLVRTNQRRRFVVIDSP